jgi:hypothetical protein
VKALKGFLSLVVVIGIFAATYGVVNALTHGGLHRTLTADFTRTSADPPADPAADPPSVIQVHIGDQIWSCHLVNGTGRDCGLTYSARLHS